MINLLSETIECLHENGKTEEDVLWVGGNEFKSSWEHFSKVANVTYDNGYGAPEVATDLKIVGADFWLERHEYDGSEWWEFKQLPLVIPEKTYDFLTVVGGMWDSLDALDRRLKDNG